ncbi:hypothetical protein D2N39_11390 [Gemmobacter lutimaris]|uniref:Uncharacterized protein n=1 Tax=Gemmobacter lutimaris TaxID=2306023 RepID=A0A398BQ53_9RHOB|nr:hypothetical protein [Gemmobacter lutimaris]RID91834.1 hypothetical protein D2N39_11390 [Gemmobacter lutimaris]
MPGKTLIIDTEIYRNFFYLGIKRVEDGVRAHFEFSERTYFDFAKVRKILRGNTTVGFNSLNFDLPVIYKMLSGASLDDVKDAANHIIMNRVPHWRAERELEIVIPKNLDHIDLFEPNPSVRDGLKTLIGRMQMKRLQELPYEHDRILSPKEMDDVIEYCQYGDLDGTEELFRRLAEPLDLRVELGKTYGLELRSKSDAQVGEGILKSRVEEHRGQRIQKAMYSEGHAFRYEVPEWIKFQTPYMREVLETIRNTDIRLGKNCKVDLPKSFSDFDIQFDGLKYTLGIGGLHSTESNRSVHSDADVVLIDADVASQYPSIIMKLGLYPKAMGPQFLPVYKQIIDRRLAAKRAKDKTTDKGLKIAINGSYGKLGSAFSVLFAPHLLISVTLTGQLSLLMLIEAAHLAGIPVVSANTDGVIFKCPRTKWDGFVLNDKGKPTDRLKPSPIQDIIEWWEGLTSFNLEFAEYASVYSQSVNAYIALKPDGSYKRKGTLANHWSKELPWGEANTDYDPSRDGLKKNPQMTIVADAVLGYLRNGIPLEDTIFGCTDLRQFLCIINATGGATWGPGEPIYGTHERIDAKGKTIRSRPLIGYGGERYLGKLVRYYWSTEGNPILKRAGHPTTGNRPMVPKTEGCQPMMTLPDDMEVPDDLDRHRYVVAAHDMLRDIGAAPRVYRAPLIAIAEAVLGLAA